MKAISAQCGNDRVLGKERFVDFGEAAFVRSYDHEVDAVLRQQACGAWSARVDGREYRGRAAPGSSPCDQTCPGYPISDRRPLSDTL